MIITFIRLIKLIKWRHTLFYWTAINRHLNKRKRNISYLVYLHKGCLNLPICLKCLKILNFHSKLEKTPYNKKTLEILGILGKRQELGKN